LTDPVAVALIIRARKSLDSTFGYDTFDWTGRMLSGNPIFLVVSCAPSMPQSLANVLLHLVFSTKGRIPFIRSDIEDELWRELATICRTLGCPAHGVGGTADHVHIVCSLARTVTIADALREIKADSSKWIKRKGARYAEFAWQNGYGAFSIGQSKLDDLKGYIAGQKEHHRELTFQEEFRRLLRRYKVAFDERYVWD
jgi:REP element-mobilizing transposase RayT